MMVIRMLPEILFMLPLYIIFQQTGLFDTQLGIIIAFFRNRETVLADEMDILKW